MNGYKVETTEGSLGDIEDAIFDSEDWTVRFLVVDTSKLLPSKDVYVPVDAVKEVTWEYSTVRLDLSKDQLRSLPTSVPA